MKIHYECGICGERDENKDRIERCEAKGHPDLSLCPPLGLIVGDNCGPGMKPSGDARSPWCSGPAWNDDRACLSHLCGAGFIWVVQWSGVSHFDRHEFGVGFGVFRGNGAGDTFDFSGKATNGYDPHKMGPSKHYPEQGFRRWQEWPEAQPCPAFWRAVRAVREAGWVARVVRNGEVVDFLDPLPADPYITFPVGTEVRLKKGTKGVPKDAHLQTARVTRHLGKGRDLYAGGVVLDRALGGLQNWNVEELEVVP